MEKYIIGVDVGGTKIAAGIITSDGKLKDSVVLPTLADKGQDVSLKQVFASIEDLLSKNKLDKSSIKGIGVCAPGPLDPRVGIVHNPPNLPGWREVPLAKLVKERFGIDTKVENDANAAAVAEMVWGAAKGYKNIFYVTVSTGIGTGIIIGGKLYHGNRGQAGEGGHVVINYDDEHGKCGCGNRGCIEALASGPYTVKRLKRELEVPSAVKSLVVEMVDGDLNKITMETIASAASKGDELALRTIKQEGNLLGIWLGSMINLLDPEIIVIGGGVSFIGDLLFDEIRKSTHKHTINVFADKIPIVPAKLKKNVGIFGAASIFV